MNSSESNVRFDYLTFFRKISFLRRCTTLYVLVQLCTVRYSIGLLVCFCVSSSTGAIILKSDLIVRRRTAVHRFTFSNEKIRVSTCFLVKLCFDEFFLKSDLIVRRTAVHRFTFSNEKIDKSKSAVAIFFFSSSWLFSVSCFSCEEKNVLYLFNNWCYFWPFYFKVTRLKFVFLNKWVGFFLEVQC